MRTKLLISAAVLAASLASSMAQNVYSLNVVGYVNVTLPGGGFEAIANPLDNKDGGNNVANLFKTGIPTDSQISFWDPTAYGGAGDWVFLAAYVGTAWDPDPTGAAGMMPVGKAAQFYNAGATFVHTFVGDVVQGLYPATPAALPDYTLASGSFNVIGAPAPLGGAPANFLIGLTPAVDDQISAYDPAAFGGAGDWLPADSWNGAVWDPGTTTVAPGKAFQYYRAGGVVNWQSNFTVN